MTPEAQRQRRGRIASGLSLPPLSLIAVAFFLPTIRTCERVESMAEIAGDEPLAWLGLGAPYWVALLMLVLTIIALVKHKPPRGVEWTAFVTLGMGYLAVLGSTLAFVFSEDTDAILALAMIPVAVLPGHAFWRAMRRTEWARWARLLCAYAVLASFYAVLFLVARIEQGPGEIGVGAWLYIVADAALLAISSWVLSSSVMYKS